MRWRLVVLTLLTLAAAALVVAFASRSVALQLGAQDIYNSFSASTPPQADQDRAQQLSIESYALQLAITPVGTAAIVCGAGVLVVLSRRWQVRVKRRAPAR